ncbi:hypothetical protein [Gordonia sp. NB41Y]|uniref:hypothetical protein n=1 Tax=Gordonia sp. NB41Y TaxID=875808 RepID=UPI0006C07DA9|nr:hypothetical protein [Gordonia sp. NB41Y]KOY49171.1 hypothetical protein ISGA_11815 [Gordonia sp. NB41Y]WLP89440.1 hypothetical protein Q9K23_17905 [Gordonia sp. NB41Y]
MTETRSVRDRIAVALWPAMVVVGLLIVATSQVTWGYSNEGVGLRIGGLGGVGASSAAREDVEAFFADHTQRPGLVTLAMGLVIVVAAVVAWWRPLRGKRGVQVGAAVIGALAAIVTVIWSAVVLADPAGHLFSSTIIDAMDLPNPLLQPGWGLIATLVVGVLALIGAATAAVFAVGGRRPDDEWSAIGAPDGPDPRQS